MAKNISIFLKKEVNKKRYDLGFSYKAHIDLKVFNNGSYGYYICYIMYLTKNFKCHMSTSWFKNIRKYLHLPGPPKPEIWEAA